MQYAIYVKNWICERFQGSTASSCDKMPLPWLARKGNLCNRQFWKINCMEDKYPGLWFTWFTEQVAAVGWAPPEWGLETATAETAWKRARKCLNRIKPGDRIVVQLKNWRVGRIWHRCYSQGLKTMSGIRRSLRKRAMLARWDGALEVRWDLTTGPLAPQFAIQLPLDACPNMRIWRPTLSEMPEATFDRIEKAAVRTRKTGSASYRASPRKRAMCGVH